MYRDSRAASGRRRSRPRIAAMVVIVATVLGGVVTWGSPAEAAVVSHVCGNPSRTYNGVRSGLCSDLLVEFVDPHNVTHLKPAGQFFCQVAGGDFHLVPCAGVAYGIDLYIRRPGEPRFTQYGHLITRTCGTLNGRPGTMSMGPCANGRNTVSFTGPVIAPVNDEPRCSFYYARSRASFQLPGDPATIEGAVITSGIWQDPICER